VPRALVSRWQWHGGSLGRSRPPPPSRRFGGRGRPLASATHIKFLQGRVLYVLRPAPITCLDFTTRHGPSPSTTAGSGDSQPAQPGSLPPVDPASLPDWDEGAAQVRRLLGRDKKTSESIEDLTRREAAFADVASSSAARAPPAASTCPEPDLAAAEAAFAVPAAPATPVPAPADDGLIDPFSAANGALAGGGNSAGGAALAATATAAASSVATPPPPAGLANPGKGPPPPPFAPD